MKPNKLIIFFLLFVPFLVVADSPEKTFPKERTGITAYSKIEEVNEENSAKVINAIHSVLLEEEKKSKETYIVGKTEIEIIIEDSDGEDYHLSSLYPYIYANLKGQIAAYFPKEYPTSKILNWNEYFAKGEMESTFLEKAIESVLEKVNDLEEVEEELSLSEPAKHFHFQYPEANRMAVATNTMQGYSGESPSYDPKKKNFSVRVPGTVHESSYAFYYSIKARQGCDIALKLDNSLIDERKDYFDWCNGKDFVYGFYPKESFSPNISHSIMAKGRWLPEEMLIGTATVLLYESD